MRAIHNRKFSISFSDNVVINHNTIKIESNSQRRNLHLATTYRCYQSQNYKMWKQFTTCCMLRCVLILLLSITKLQNLKAIHNCRVFRLYAKCVVINHKITKFESNSQQNPHKNILLLGCYQSQNYKIWKQFTTPYRWMPVIDALLSIIKLQNLKAIHNFSSYKSLYSLVVINHKTTKFESNSQLFLHKKVLICFII